MEAIESAFVMVLFLCAVSLLFSIVSPLMLCFSLYVAKQKLWIFLPSHLNSFTIKNQNIRS